MGVAEIFYAIFGVGAIAGGIIVLRDRAVTLENDNVKFDVKGREAYGHGVVSLVSGIVTLGGLLLGSFVVASFGFVGIVLGSTALALISVARTGWSDIQQKRKTKS